MLFPRISFGMIVLNGEPFLQANLQALYPFAHQILVVEGAVPAAAAAATDAGHSRDRTLSIVREFQRDHDPRAIVTLITAEDHGYPNGFWPGEKLEQSRAYAARADGEWLWQVDVDEFYLPGDMLRIADGLLRDPTLMSVSFPQLLFWGGIDYVVDGWYLRWLQPEVHRIFRWGAEMQLVDHRPPTVINGDGVDLRRLPRCTAAELRRLGIYLYHYSTVLPQQTLAKSAYYARAPWAAFPAMNEWAEQQFFALRDAFHVHNVYHYPSWLRRFHGDHPPVINALWQRLQQDGTVLRPTADLQRLTARPDYRLACLALALYGLLRVPLELQLTALGRRLPQRMRRRLRGLVGRWLLP